MAARPDVCKTLDPHALQRDFPIFTRTVHDKSLIYLDNAATTQKPRSVIEAVTRYYETYNANVHRAVHTLSHEASVAYEEAHKKAAQFVNARSWREIVFTRNATEALNLVAYAWGMHNLQAGDEVLVTIMEHHSDIVPWQMLRQLKQITVKFLDVTDDGRLKLGELPKRLTKRTKLVGVIYASNVLGTVNPLKTIIEEAKKVGAVTVIDAAQAAPHIPIDVQAVGCDFLAVSGHKMLGPTGIGFLWGRKELLEAMHPFLHGGDMISTVTTESVTFNELPWKFEAGTPNIAGGIGLGAAIDYLCSLGLENIYTHEQRLLEYALEKLSQINGLEIYGPKETEDRLAVISFNLKGIHPHDVAGILDEAGIAVRSGHHCAQPLMKRLGMDNTARASFYIYNSEDDVDALVEALKTAQKLFA
jgi:cysteine desulfurase/selenocysteine lyase